MKWGKSKLKWSRPYSRKFCDFGRLIFAAKDIKADIERTILMCQFILFKLFYFSTVLFISLLFQQLIILKTKLRSRQFVVFPCRRSQIRKKSPKKLKNNCEQN